MKKYRVLLFALVALWLLPTARARAAGASVTVATTAGGTAVSPAGPGYVLFLVNTGANVVDCLINGGGTVSATNYDFQLAASGGTWLAPQITYAPNQIGAGAPRIAGSEGVTCIAITSSSTVTWYKR